MAIEVTMPQLSDTMSEGTILTWRKKEGEKISRGDALAEVATDKADLEIESFHEGTLLRINTPAGTKVKVGAVIAVIGESGENIAAPAAAPSAQTAEPAKAVASAPASNPTSNPTSNHTSNPASNPASSPTVAPPLAEPSSHAGERIKISPLAKNVAEAHGIDFSTVHGSGDGGRIVRRDIEMLMESVPTAPIVKNPASRSTPAPALPAPVPPQSSMPPSGMGKSEPLSTMRTTIASRMVESVTTIPHFYVTSKINMSEVKRLRASLKELPQYEGITFNHIIIKAVALALRKYPAVNSSYQAGNLVQPSDVNVGIVTAVPGGLLIPVVKRADVSPLADIVADAKAMVQRARAGKPKADDLSGGTFSISNMGMFAVESFTAIISPGQGAILAVSAIEDEPVVSGGGVIVAPVVRATLSVDHRIIDGVMAGEFLTELRRLLQDPVLLLA